MKKERERSRACTKAQLGSSFAPLNPSIQYSGDKETRTSAFQRKVCSLTLSCESRATLTNLAFARNIHSTRVSNLETEERRNIYRVWCNWWYKKGRWWFYMKNKIYIIRSFVPEKNGFEKFIEYACTWSRFNSTDFIIISTNICKHSQCSYARAQNVYLSPIFFCLKIVGSDVHVFACITLLFLLNFYEHFPMRYFAVSMLQTLQ